MRVLLTGSTGFIGRRLAMKLRAAGHIVIGTTRDPARHPGSIQADFSHDLNVDNWLPRLSGIDAVINAVGILREHGEQSFERIHARAPQALFAACRAAGVRRVIQISALGADHGDSGYFSSKRAADQVLETMPLAWTIVQPSLVFGRGGTSSRLFLMLATLPLVGLPGRGLQPVQPVHVDDVVDAIVRLLGRDDFDRRRIALVGPRAMPFRELLARLRAAFGLRPALFLPIPMTVMRLAAGLGQLSRRSLLDRETLAMLEAGNTADPLATTALLDRTPRPVESFIDDESSAAVLREAQLSWLLPLLRYSIATVWIWTGIVSLGLFPREASYELLARVGASRTSAPWLLFGAAALDLSFGLATLLMRSRRLLWLAQAAVIVVYTLIITVKLPEFWLHPYGPIVKNLPLLAGIYLLYSLERSRWNISP